MNKCGRITTTIWDSSPVVFINFPSIYLTCPKLVAASAFNQSPMTMIRYIHFVRVLSLWFLWDRSSKEGSPWMHFISRPKGSRTDGGIYGLSRGHFSLSFYGAFLNNKNILVTLIFHQNLLFIQSIIIVVVRRDKNIYREILVKYGGGLNLHRMQRWTQCGAPNKFAFTRENTRGEKRSWHKYTPRRLDYKYQHDPLWDLLGTSSINLFIPTRIYDYSSNVWFQKSAHRSSYGNIFVPRAA